MPDPATGSDAARFDWADLGVLRDEVFSIWSDAPEQEWARKAWDCLSRDGLTQAPGVLARLQVRVRFCVLGSLYRDWCALVWDERHDDEPQMWLGEDEPLNAVHIGQLVGLGLDLDSDDPDDCVNEALVELMAQERPAVVESLMRHLGGVPGLFISLSRSRDDEDTDEEDRPDDDDLLNTVTGATLAGYGWLADGCPTTR